MSEFHDDSDYQSIGKRKTLSRNTTPSAIPASQKTNSIAADANSISNMQDKKPKKESIKEKSVKDIFSETFSVQKDKDGNVKSARISKTDLKLLCSTEKVDGFNSELVQMLCNNAELTDQSLSCLTEIVVSVLGVEHADRRKKLFGVCVNIASGVWINKHRGSLDLYEDIFSGDSKEKPIQLLELELKRAFEKRLAKLRTLDGDRKSETDNSDELTDEACGRGYETKYLLDKQHHNLLIVGVIWLLEKGKETHEAVISYFLKVIDSRSNSKATLSDVSMFLASQCVTPDAVFCRIVSLLQYQLRLQADDRSRFQELLKQREQKILKLEAEMHALRDLEEITRHQVLSYQASIKDLEKRLENQKLDERASRTHLRDSEGKVRAKAFNLLSEEVLDPLKLSLAALQRENPKTENAIHHIELVIDSIERDLTWFKE